MIFWAWSQTKIGFISQEYEHGTLLFCWSINSSCQSSATPLCAEKPEATRVSLNKTQRNHMGWNRLSNLWNVTKVTIWESHSLNAAIDQVCVDVVSPRTECCAVNVLLPPIKDSPWETLVAPHPGLHPVRVRAVARTGQTGTPKSKRVFPET